MSNQERDKLDQEFNKDIEDRHSTLARLAPNLKAMEQYQAVKVSSAGVQLHAPVLTCIRHAMSSIASAMASDPWDGGCEVS